MTKYRDMDDGTLVNLALLGEEGAFEELVERHEHQVKQKAEAIIGNPYSAEDVAQDSFISAWVHLAELHYPPKSGIGIIRIHVLWNGREYKEGPDLDPVEFYRQLETIEDPKNHLLSQGEN